MSYVGAVVSLTLLVGSMPGQTNVESAPAPPSHSSAVLLALHVAVQDAGKTSGAATSLGCAWLDEVTKCSDLAAADATQRKELVEKIASELEALAATTEVPAGQRQTYLLQGADALSSLGETAGAAAWVARSLALAPDAALDQLAAKVFGQGSNDNRAPARLVDAAHRRVSSAEVDSTATEPGIVSAYLQRLLHHATASGAQPWTTARRQQLETELVRVLGPTPTMASHADLMRRMVGVSVAMRNGKPSPTSARNLDWVRLRQPVVLKSIGVADAGGSAVHRFAHGAESCFLAVKGEPYLVTIEDDARTCLQVLVQLPDSAEVQDGFIHTQLTLSIDAEVPSGYVLVVAENGSRYWVCRSPVTRQGLALRTIWKTTGDLTRSDETKLTSIETNHVRERLQSRTDLALPTQAVQKLITSAKGLFAVPAGAFVADQDLRSNGDSSWVIFDTFRAESQ